MPARGAIRLTTVRGVRERLAPDRTLIVSGPAGKLTASADTDASGRFRTAPRQFWWIYIVPMDVFDDRTDVTVRAVGYESAAIPLKTNAVGPRDVSLGEIHLKPRTL